MFKINDSVVCIDNDGDDTNLTIGRTYVVTRVWPISIWVEDDAGAICYFSKSRFVPLAQYREDNPVTTGWDYAVADALRKKASDAIDEYNAYVDKQPTTTYYKLHKGY